MPDRKAERQRIRDKLSETDRKFLDALKGLFPNSKLRHLYFYDGEEIGK